MPNPLKLADVAVSIAEGATGEVLAARRAALGLAEEASVAFTGAIDRAGKSAAGLVELHGGSIAGNGGKVSKLGQVGRDLAGDIDRDVSAVDWLSRAKSTANPYLAEFNATQADPAYRRAIDITRCRIPSTTEEYTQAYRTQMNTRFGLTHKYAWAVPNAEALATVAQQGKVVEAGAGSGYWASLLREMKADVVAFDVHGTGLQGSLDANRFHSGARAWTDIVRGDATAIKQYPDRSLFMSFPPEDDPFAYDVLRRYKGDRFVYVGEPAGGVTGDEKFHNLVARGWKEVKTVEIPRWESSSGFLQDALTLYERR